MKKIKLLFVALFLLMATIANAQFANSSALSGSAVGSSDIEGGWSGITASYNSNTWDAEDADFDNIHGLELGYLYGMRLSANLPLYLESGLLANYAFGELYNEDEVTLSASMFSLKVPVTLGYKVDVADQFSILPYAGLYLRGNLAGTLTYEYEWDDEEEELDLFDKDEGDANRFQFGMHVGVRCLVNNFNFGIGYGFDFNELAEDVKTSSLNFTIGYNF